MPAPAVTTVAGLQISAQVTEDTDIAFDDEHHGGSSGTGDKNEATRVATRFPSHRWPLASVLRTWN